MFDEERPKKKTSEFPRNLENLSLSELDEYVEELNAEITRVQEDAAKKKESQNAAASVFKS